MSHGCHTCGMPNHCVCNDEYVPPKPPSGPDYGLEASFIPRQSPPCSGCADNPLICDACLYSEAELDSMGESKPSGEGESK